MPSNLLLQYGRLKVIDFGLGDSTASESLENGINWFKAPVVQDKRSLEQDDVYSIGCILLLITTVMCSITSSQVGNARNC